MSKNFKFQYHFIYLGRKEEQENVLRKKKKKIPAIIIGMMHAKALQSCLTLCDPMDRSPPGSSVHSTLQARILEWAAISLSNEREMKMTLGMKMTLKQKIKWKATQ